MTGSGNGDVFFYFQKFIAIASSSLRRALFPSNG
jgi:hypothetical protein